MRRDALFFKLFPPPKFLTMPHAGLEISDDALRTIEYSTTPLGIFIAKYGKSELPRGLIENGEIRDEKQFNEVLKNFVHTNKLSYVKVSLPEEKVYLFEIDIPSTNVKAITQHVEFKLEENVPISAADAVFYFDILPSAVTGTNLKASVSVAPRTYIEKLLAALHGLNMVPIAFEVAPKAIARAVIPAGSNETYLIVHLMDKKTGMYIVCGGVVCFSSTLNWGTRPDDSTTAPTELAVDTIAAEINRVYAYWTTRPDTHSSISEIILVGRDSPVVDKSFHARSITELPQISTAAVWRNAFDINKYIPPIKEGESQEYTVAAGLALPS